MSSIELTARHLIYTGEVQGVGFRYTARSIATSYGVKGWVRNLPDGRVEVHVEGTEAEVDAVLKAIRDYWGESITDVETLDAVANGATVFEVRR